jgi:Na+/glutamate symporter
MGVVAGVINAIILANQEPGRTVLDGLGVTLFGAAFGLAATGVGGPVINWVVDRVNSPTMPTDGPDADYHDFPRRPPTTGP